MVLILVGAKRQLSTMTWLLGASQLTKPACPWLSAPSKLPSNLQLLMVRLAFSIRPTKPLIVLSPLPVQVRLTDDWQFSMVTFAPLTRSATRPVAYIWLDWTDPAICRLRKVALPT